MKKSRFLLLVLILLLTACDKQEQAASFTVTPTAISAETKIESTETPISLIPKLPEPTSDPMVFGALGTDEIQAYAMESVANAIFKKTMDSFVAADQIQEYQVTSVTVFPGSNGLLAEIIFNVRTNDPAWIVQGGTPTNDNWFHDQCFRFDFFTTETEYQLKNRRLCG